MFKNKVDSNKLIVMLTADRQIDRRILQIADSIEKAGWNVIIIAMPSEITLIDDDPRVVRIGSENSFTIKANLIVYIYHFLRKYLPMNGFLMRWLKRFTWLYLVNPETFYTKLFYHKVTQYSPSILVANDLPMLPIAKLIADRCNAKLIYDSHELYTEQEFSEREKKRWAAIERKYIYACSCVITVNHSIARELKNRYNIKNVEVIYNAERTGIISNKSRYFHDKFFLSFEKKILLLQGGLSAGRNLEALLNSMIYVNNSSVVLVFLGDGQLIKKLQAKVKKQNLTDRVFFHPAVPQKELLTLTAAASAGVIPYQANCLNNYYCTPNKLFEFIIAGIPILSTDLPETRNIITNYNIGLVGDTSSAQSFANCINHFFSDEQRLELWENNLKNARREICWEVEEKKLIKIYGAI